MAQGSPRGATAAPPQSIEADDPGSVDALVQLLRDTDPDRIRWRTQYTRRLARAVLLAPTIEICEALLHGEPVPVKHLDPLWAKRYGIT